MIGIVAFAAFRAAYRGDHALFPNMLAAQLMFVPLVLAISFIRPVQQAILRAIDRARHPSLQAKLLWAIALAAIAFIYLWRGALLHERDLSPRLQDEFSYLIQAQLLSHGRLWLPSPPLADFFETFHVVVKPVYASVYFPGTAMLYVPSVLLHAPHHWTALLICAAGVGLVYLLATELLDGAYGILAALMLLSTRAFYIHSTLVLSNVPAMVAGVMVYLAWLKWEKTDRARMKWAILLGAAAGWGLIVRPLDMIAYLVPIVCLALTSILSRRTGRGGGRIAPSPGTPGEGGGEGL
ncbi:MAG: glycosyltransferase family 39 protein, partial [Anaerolineae bacterium]|nr:glycosyltransferase family 39 protein [Phycisphaerae bacterium]